MLRISKTTGETSVRKLAATEYIKLPTTSGAPAAADCASPSDYGRMKVDPNNAGAALWICIGNDGGGKWIAK